MITFNLKSREPVRVRINGKVYSLPRFKRKNWREWQEELDAEREAKAMENLDEEQRARMMLLYPLEPLTKANMRARLDTLEGTGKIFRVCAAAGGVPEADIEEIVDAGEIDEVDLESIVLVLASLVDAAEIAKRLGLKPDADGQDEDGAKAEAKRPLPGKPAA